MKKVGNGRDLVYRCHSLFINSLTQFSCRLCLQYVLLGVNVHKTGRISKTNTEIGQNINCVCVCVCV